MNASKVGTVLVLVASLGGCTESTNSGNADDGQAGAAGKADDWDCQDADQDGWCDDDVACEDFDLDGFCDGIEGEEFCADEDEDGWCDEEDYWDCADSDQDGYCDLGYDPIVEQPQLTLISYVDSAGLDVEVSLEPDEVPSFIDLVTGPGLEEQDVLDFLDTVPSDAPEADETDSPDDWSHRFNGCATTRALVTDHIRQKHVGKTDAQLKERAGWTGKTSSWANADLAWRSLRALVNKNCNNILLWQRYAAVGAKEKWWGNTSVTGRSCTPSSCRNVTGATIHFKKVWEFAGFTATFITTGYPT